MAAHLRIISGKAGNLFDGMVGDAHPLAAVAAPSRQAPGAFGQEPILCLRTALLTMFSEGSADLHGWRPSRRTASAISGRSRQRRENRPAAGHGLAMIGH
jgi:hypothetical protein